MKSGEYEEQYNMYFQLPEKPYKGVAFLVNVKYKFKDNKYTLLEATVNEEVITPSEDNILDILVAP